LGGGFPAEFSPEIGGHLTVPYSNRTPTAAGVQAEVAIGEGDSRLGDRRSYDYWHLRQTGDFYFLTQGLSARKTIVARMRYFYRLRGTVTHGGRQGILPSDVAELRYYVQHIISLMITNLAGWTSLKDFHDWLEDQRLS